MNVALDRELKRVTEEHGLGSVGVPALPAPYGLTMEFETGLPRAESASSTAV